MRLSIREGDRSDRTFEECLSGNFQIVLDGVPQQYVLMADEEMGCVVRYKESWELVHGEPVTEAVFGEVKILQPYDSAAWTGRDSYNISLRRWRFYYRLREWWSERPWR